MRDQRGLDLRKQAVHAIRELPLLADWTFEFTPAAPSNAIEGYEQAAKSADVLLYLVTDAISDAVKREVRIALRARVPVLVLDLRRRDDDAQVQEFIDELALSVKYQRVPDDTSLKLDVQVAIGDLLKVALRDWQIPSRRFSLEKQYRETAVRVALGFEAAGLDTALAERLSADASIGARREVLPSAPFVILQGNVGVGKSLLGERWHARSILAAIDDPRTPVPCRFKAAQLTPGDIASQIDMKTESLGQWRETGVALFVDGLDEPGVRGAETLLQELRVISRISPNSRFLVTTRPGYFERSDERVTLQPLSEPEACALVALAAERDVSLHEFEILAPSLRKTIRAPLFALIFGVLLAEKSSTPVMDGLSLLDAFVDRALGRAHADTAAASEILRRLAITMLHSGIPIVSPVEVSRGMRADLLRSRLVQEDENQGLMFSLPALVDWFGSEAIRDDTVPLDEVYGSEARIYSWRYPLAVAIRKSSTARASMLLQLLFERRPGSAAIVVVDAFDQYMREGIGELPASDEAAQQIMAAYQVVQASLGKLRQFSTREDASGPYPIRAYTAGRTLEVEYLCPLPEGAPFSRPFHAVRGVDTRPGWAFRYVLDEARKQLAEAFEHRALWLDDGPEIAEWHWLMAWQYADDRGFVDLANLRTLLENAPREQSLFNRSGTAGALLEFCISAMDAGQRTASDLYPGYTLWGAAHLSDVDREVLRERVAQIIRNALVIYRQLVDTWFPPLFHEALNLYRLFPVRADVILAEGFPKSTRIWARHDIVPLNLGEETTLSVRIGTWGNNEMAHSRSLWEENRLKRGEPPVDVLSWYGFAMPFQDRPATTLAYRWLRDDLKKLRWLE